MNPNNTIDVLNELIATCNDGHEGFKTAADSVKRLDLKNLFVDLSMQRARFANELQTEVLALGGEPETTGSVGGALHRVWIDVKGVFTGMDDGTILEGCERAEDATMKVYRSVLSDTTLPEIVRSLVERQAAAVRLSQRTTRNYRERAAYA